MTSIIGQIVETQKLVRRMKGQRPLRLRKPRRQKQPLGEERIFRAELFAILEQVKRLVDAELIPRLPELERVAANRSDMRLDVDTWSQRLRRILEQIRAALGEDDPRRRLAGQTARTVASRNLTEIRGQFRAVLGIDVFFNDPQLEATLDDFTEANVGLIRSIAEQYLEQVEGIVRRGFRGGRRASDIAADIADRFGVARSRAAFIARDQVSKLNANLTRNRQRALGIEEYIWRTSLDERVRPTHARLEGTTHSWDDPPSVGGGRTAHPGEDFRCRCTAEPVIEI